MLPWVSDQKTCETGNQQSSFSLCHSHFHSLSLTSLDLSCGPRLSLSWRFLINVIISLYRMINWMKFNIHNWIGICSAVLASIVNRWSIRKASRIRLTLAHSHFLPLKTILVAAVAAAQLSVTDWTDWGSSTKGFKARILFLTDRLPAEMCVRYPTTKKKKKHSIKGNFY